MAYLVDSDWLISCLGGDAEATGLLVRLASEGLAISVITYVEVYEGVLHASDQETARRELGSLLSDMRMITVTPRIARECAAIRIELRLAGRRVNQRALDLLIAATANVYGLTVVTRNVGDYRDIPGISLYPA